VPLDFDGIMDGTFVLRHEEPESSNNGAVASGSGRKSVKVEPAVNGHAHEQPNGTAAAGATHGLKDQRALTLRDNLLLFVARCVCDQWSGGPHIDERCSVRTGWLHGSRTGKTLSRSTRTTMIPSIL